MEITKLIVKKLRGTISMEEERTFASWLEEAVTNRELFSNLSAIKDRGVDIPDFKGIDPARAWVEVIEKYGIQNSVVKNRPPFHNYLKYAALFLGLLGLSYGYWFYSASENEAVQIDPEAITLQLENGEVRVLVAEESRNITDTKGNVLGSQKKDQIDYTNTDVGQKLVYNTLRVPNGKMFKILLSDGSSVHLNSGSSLKYPVKFLAQNERHVYLNGEGYFDVEKDQDQPFIVTSGDMDVRVLGTEFNVTAYPEDAEIKTVLVEGSVSLYGAETPYKASTATLLKPGQKGAWRSSKEKVVIQHVDTHVYTGWREGKLVLKKMRFEDIVRRLQRHYNIKIDNHYSDLDNRIFTATFDVETIAEVLETFREETYFEYLIGDAMITIQEPDINL